MTNGPLPDRRTEDGVIRDASAFSKVDAVDANRNVGVETADHRSLREDISAFFEDGKTYLQAELAFQKSRGSFAAARARKGLVFGVAAVALFHLALIGLVVGLIIALAPLITIWGAVVAVVGVLLVAGVLLGLMAKKRFTALASAFRSTDR